MDRNLLREKRGTTVRDRYPDAVQYVIAVGLEKDLHTIRRNPRQKAADLLTDQPGANGLPDSPRGAVRQLLRVSAATTIGSAYEMPKPALGARVHSVRIPGVLKRRRVTDVFGNHSASI